MKDEQAKARPTAVVRIGAVRASIWKNESKNGIWFSVTVDRFYRDEEKRPRSSSSFGRDDLLALAKVIDQAHTRILELSSEEEMS